MPLENKRPHLVIMCDYGLDDATATADVLYNRERFGKIDIVAVGGNMPASVSLRNARTLLSLFPEYTENVRIVDTTDIPQPCEELFDIHGEDGMGGLFAPAESDVPVVKYRDFIAETKECDILLSLGPMTVTEDILRHVKPGKFVFMAGCVDGTPNYNGYEFNHGVAPAAFTACAKYPHKAVLLDAATEMLDVTKKKLPTDDRYPVYYKCMKRYIELITALGEDGVYVWDDIAVQYVLRPECFSVTEKTDKWGNVLESLSFEGEYPVL